MTRLESLSWDLAKKLKSATNLKQRAAALAACEFVISRRGLDDSLTKHALAQLQESKSYSVQTKLALESLTEELDEEYFTLQEEAEEQGSSDEKHVEVFKRARAVATLSFAGDADPFVAASEAIYEATAALDDSEKADLIRSVESLLFE